MEKHQKHQNSNIPWEIILELISHLLDPKTIGVSLCVSKEWNSLLSSNHIWKPRLTSNYPSTSTSTMSPHRLYSILQSCRRKKSKVLKIAMEQVFFMVDIFQSNNSVLSFIVQGSDLAGKYKDERGLFLFDVEMDESNGGCGKSEGVRVVWNVVMEGWRGCFLMMDRRCGKDRTWLVEELPGHGCCGFIGGKKGGLAAEVGLQMVECEGGRRRVERVRLGLMDADEWRYMTVADALLYLQDFLL